MTNTVRIGLDAADVVDELRRHHPAYSGPSGMQWTTLTEWKDIDLVALECWQAARVIGYEVKVSRSDMRSELLNPTKRMEAVARCTQFYFAVPAGMLTASEIEFVEPAWSLSDFERAPCTHPDCTAKRYLGGRGWMKKTAKPRGSKRRGTETEGMTIHLGTGHDHGVDEYGETYSHHYPITACCTICCGYGKIGRSRVEDEAPTLWVPKDVGLVEVSSRGVVEIKMAPTNKTPKPIIGGLGHERESANRMMRQGLALLARHASAYQDPRHRIHRDR